MLMLTANLDETRHSADKNQKFVGMAGLFASAKNWEQFERQWNKTLHTYEIPYFHVKDFAHSRGFFEDWKGKEYKGRNLFVELIQAILDAKAIPFGSTIPMEIFKQKPECLQNANDNPYFLAFFVSALILVQKLYPLCSFGETVTTVFAEQQEFQRKALRIFERLKIDMPEVGELFDSPVFRPMHKLAPLQAADLVAYEAHKEAERQLYRPNDKPRWGWIKLDEIHKTNGKRFASFVFQDEFTVSEYMKGVKKGN
jgi:hypothetical protein